VVDALTAEAVLPLLRGRFGRPYRYEPVTASTQRLLGPDAPEGAVAVADAQTEGRGRLGRRWLDAPGKSLLVSISLRPSVPTQLLPELSLVAGRACAEAVAACAGLAPELKFPNDVLVGGRKLAGMLAEAREGHVVLGVGVNVNLTAEELPADVDTPATSLLVETGAALPRAVLLAELLLRLELRYDEWVSPRP
jgi:BirA family transcriptional regulator, biotin operon repressor / biotin---[acetyl-CoA-carboxylase] ligase